MRSAGGDFRLCRRHVQGWCCPARLPRLAWNVAHRTAPVVLSYDTLTLSNGQRVRLLQIDTPELGTGECYSRAARTELLRLVPIGSRVSLEADPRLDRVDRYGRLLRYVVRKGLNVNLELVRRGAAAPYFYGGDKGRYAERSPWLRPARSRPNAASGRPVPRRC
jgi:endonuclease YncB( thermonuclease family)